MSYSNPNQLHQLHQKQDDRPHDVVIVIGDTKFYLFRNYLANWSKYFDRLFYGDFKEKHQKEIKLEEVDVDAFDRVLHYINPHLHWELGSHDVLKVLKLADRFEIPYLMGKCGKLLCDFDKCESLELLDRLEIADNHNLVSLQIACFERIHGMDEHTRAEFFEKKKRHIKNLSHNVIMNLI